MFYLLDKCRPLYVINIRLMLICFRLFLLSVFSCQFIFVVTLSST